MAEMQRPNHRIKRPALPGAAIALAAVLIYLLVPPAVSADPQQCPPTRPDMKGPFYQPDAPLRDKVGSGYLLTGTVRAAGSCTPIPDARIELWLAGPDGSYGDDYRASLFSDAKGGYRFESHRPPGYHGRPPHIHIRVSAQGFQTLVTQHYPESGASRAEFDLVLKAE
jgi:protocatechuate 3,4-dioxygenase beta subunit